jgi:hypothetical protein
MQKIKFLYPFLFILLTTFNSFADDSKEFYNTAVLGMDCKTIRFIHLETGRTQEAKKLNNCFTFDAIFATIPEEEKTTKKLAEEIKASEKKYNPSAELEPQLDQLIEFIGKKIKAKKRKNSVDDFIQELENVKKDVLADYKKSKSETKETENVKTTNNQKPKSENPELANNPEPVSPEAELQPENSKKSDGNILGWVGILFGLIALGISAFAMFRMKNQLEALSNKSSDKDLIVKTNDSSNNYRAIEQKFDGLIKDLKAEIDSLKSQNIQNTTSSIGMTAQMPESPKAEFNPIHVEPSFGTMDDFQDNIESSTKSEDLVNVANFTESIHQEMPMEQIQVETPEVTYNYVPLPNDPNYFEVSSMSLNPDMDSVFELGLFPNEPDIAFFALVDSPININRCLSNPAVYLQPFCEFAEEVHGKTEIVLIEEGALQKVNNQWMIRTKSKIKLK